METLREKVYNPLKKFLGTDKPISNILYKKNGTIIITCADQNTATDLRISDDWYTKEFTQITKKENSYAILKNVHCGLSLQKIIEETGAKQAKWLTKQPEEGTENHKKGVVLLTFNNLEESNNFTKETTISIESRIIYIQQYIPKQKISKCYNCWQNGHQKHNCKNETTCGKCGANHSIFDCKLENDFQQFKCVTCITSGKNGMGHAAFYPKCPSNNHR